MSNFENTLSFAQQMDEKDPLKSFRERFHLPNFHEKTVRYFTGNSLGLQPKSTKEYLLEELDAWSSYGVEAHFLAKKPWFSYHENLTNKVANIVGAKPIEVVVTHSLTTNLHLLMVSFFRPEGKRKKLICEAKAFPSDQYALESQVKFHGFDYNDAVIEIAPRADEHCIRTEDVLAAINEHKDSLALVLFGGVNYYTGQVFDMKTITAAAHNVGILCGFDLAHAAGNIELHLHDWEVDFACWCSYKYLNSGPGGVSGVYIHEKHSTNTDLQRFAGWWGYEKETRFKMGRGFKAIPTAEGWQLSNAPILSMAAHKAALDIIEEAGMERLLAKGKMLSNYLLFVIDSVNNNQNIEIITPKTETEKGCQVSMLMKQNGKQIFDELTKQGVIADWREPNVIRIAPVPLYNRFEDVWKFGNIVSGLT